MIDSVSVAPQGQGLSQKKTCEMCGGYVLAPSAMTSYGKLRQGSSVTLTMRRHQKVCRRATPAQREYYRLNRKWQYSGKNRVHGSTNGSTNQGAK